VERYIIGGTDEARFFIREVHYAEITDTRSVIPPAATSALADDMKPPINAAQLKWAPAPDFFPKAAHIAVLSGDPSKEGLYVVRLKLPADETGVWKFVSIERIAHASATRATDWVGAGRRRALQQHPG
jgi:hypothetical protein